MMDLSGTEVVFAELERSYKEILNYRRFPARFRRSFEEYLYKSQQLTEVMRREYPVVTDKPWVADSFLGWNAYTAALKVIRNVVAHGRPLLLQETTLAVYPAVQFAIGDWNISPRQMAAGVRLIKGISFVDFPFQEETVTSNIGFPAPCGGHIFPLKEFISYELHWLLLEAGARASMERTGTKDVVRLVLGSYPVLSQYYSYYRSMAKENEWM